MYKNVANQTVSFMILNPSFHPATGETGLTVSISIDGGTQYTGSGTITEIGNGIYLYECTQADTNGNNISFICHDGNNVIPSYQNIYTQELIRSANLVQIDGNANADATLNLKKLNIVNAGDKAVYITSSSSDAMQILSTGDTGGALNIQSQTVNSALGIQSNNSPVGTSATHAINIQGYGNGIQIGGGVTSGVGNGIGIGGGSTSGSGIAISTVNGHGVTIIGSGSNHAINLTNSGTGNGISASATGGHGLSVTSSGNHGALITTSANNFNGCYIRGSTGTNSVGLSIQGFGNSSAVSLVGGATGNGITVTGGSTSGSCISMSNTSGSQVVISSNTSNNPAVVINGNSGGTSGRAVYLLSPVGGGEAFLAQSLNNSSAFGITAGGAGIGMRIAGTSIGLSINGGSTGAGVRIAGGTTSGNAVNVITTDGDAISSTNGNWNGVDIPQTIDEIANDTETYSPTRITR